MRLHYQIAAAPRLRCLSVLLWESIAWHESTAIRRKLRRSSFVAVRKKTGATTHDDRDDLDFLKQEKELFLKDLPQLYGLFEGLELNDESDEEDNEES